MIFLAKNIEENSQSASVKLRKTASQKVRKDSSKVRKKVRNPTGKKKAPIFIPERKLKSIHRQILVKVHELQPDATLTTISRSLHRPVETVFYNLKNLLFSNYVEIGNSGMKTYVLAPRGKQAIANFIRGSDEKFAKPVVRAHDILFKAKVLRFPKHEELASMGFEHHEKMKGWQRPKYFGVLLDGVVPRDLWRKLR
jgi:hypothetical protein